jgi:hypothetical protein
VLVLLAIDIGRSASELQRDDAAFARSGAGDWSDVGATPLGLGRRMLGLADDLAFRLAVKRFTASRPDPANPAGSLAVARQSRGAERVLEPLASRDPNHTRRSLAANLLAVLAFEAGRANPEAAVTLQTRTIDELRASLAASPNDEAAKFNLELALSLSGQGGIGNQGNGRGNQASTVAASVSPAGNGY